MSIQQNVNAMLGIAGALYTQSPTAELRKENKIAEFNKQKELKELEKEKKEVYDYYSTLKDGKLDDEMYGKATGAGIDHDTVINSINNIKQKRISELEKKDSELNDRILELQGDYAGKYRKDIASMAIKLSDEQTNMSILQKKEAAERLKKQQEEFAKKWKEGTLNE